MAWFESHLNGGGGGGGAQLTFNKTSVVDKTKFPDLSFNEDYTTYELLLFVYSDPEDSKTIEVLTTPEIMEEAYAIYNNAYGVFECWRPKTGTITYGNHYARYKKVDNKNWQQINYRNLALVDVYSVTCNKTIVKDDIYKRGGTSTGLVPISHNNILENDLILFGTAENGLCSMNSSFLNLMNGMTDIFSTVGYSLQRFNTSSLYSEIDNNSMTDNYYFMVQGIKFT